MVEYMYEAVLSTRSNCAGDLGRRIVHEGRTIRQVVPKGAQSRMAIQNKEFYLVGEMARLAGLSIGTLRHYDQIGLLVPARVDPQTNYRYYRTNQLLQLSLIKELQSLGFSLQEIAQLLPRNDLNRLATALQQRLQQTKRELENLKAVQEQLADSLWRVNQLAESDGAAGPVSPVRLQQVPEAWLAYTRYHSPCDPDAFLLRFSELRQLMREHAMQGRGCQMAIFHDDYQQFNYEKADIEVCMELRGLTAAEPQALLRLRQPHTVATILHRGSYQQSPQSYRVLLDWIWKHGWQAVGPAQERYLVDAGQTQDSRDYLTELAIPVEQK
jgi:DNA-binding transcriptional MerR regulator/effector-binding domain-containing protein